MTAPLTEITVTCPLADAAAIAASITRAHSVTTRYWDGIQLNIKSPTRTRTSDDIGAANRAAGAAGQAAGMEFARALEAVPDTPYLALSRPAIPHLDPAALKRVVGTFSTASGQVHRNPRREEEHVPDRISRVGRITLEIYERHNDPVAARRAADRFLDLGRFLGVQWERVARVVQRVFHRSSPSFGANDQSVGGERSGPAAPPGPDHTQGGAR